ncbi:MAG TPA: NAD(+) diphosphatase [Usitatibacter sp.]|nr:NAD(+) diphosphatase [Usitatibacter sp.]
MIATPPSFTPLTQPPADAAKRRVFAFRGNELLLGDPALEVPGASIRGTLGIEEARFLPVGLYGGEYCEAAWLEKDALAPAGYAFRGLRSLFGKVDEALLAVAGRAFQIADWARTHRYCGACGRPMQQAPGERAMKCECGHVAYPRISPAMMVLVKRGAAILLARNAAAPAGRMSALAGFVEPGESVEDAIHREVREEVGIEVRDLRYFASQSWPFPGSLMLAFTAEYAGGELAPDRNEIVEARWFAPGDPLPELSPRQSISRALIDANLPNTAKTGDRPQFP